MKRSGAAAFSWEKNERQQLEHPGTGTPDTTKHEWREFQMRETLATVLLLPGMLTYQSMALGEPESVVHTQIIEQMVQPCGPIPQSAGEKMMERAKAAQIHPT